MTNSRVVSTRIVDLVKLAVAQGAGLSSGNIKVFRSMSTGDEKILFTVDEARRLLPRVRETVRKAMEVCRRMRPFEAEVRKLAENATNNSGNAAGTLYSSLLVELQDSISKIQGLGVLVKSVEEGLIDFPHWREGREVYLCWRYGEDDIQHWHDVEDGFAGRRPLAE